MQVVVVNGQDARGWMSSVQVGSIVYEGRASNVQREL